MHGDPADVTVAKFDLAGVQPDPDPQADPTQLVPERGRAPDGSPGTVEGGQDPIAGRLDQLAAELLNPGHRTRQPSHSHQLYAAAPDASGRPPRCGR
jgi:hypothetical protein